MSRTLMRCWVATATIVEGELKLLLEVMEQMWPVGGCPCVLKRKQVEVTGWPVVLV